jgi:hypothetical protein
MKRQQIAGCVFNKRTDAEFYAKAWRSPAVRPDLPGRRSVRIYPRDVRAGGAILQAFAVVVFAEVEA